MDVDEARADDLACCVEDAAALQTRSDVADSAAGDGDVGGVTGGAGAVHHGAPPYDDVCVHPPIVAALTPRCTRLDGSQPGSDTVEVQDLAELAGWGE